MNKIKKSFFDAVNNRQNTGSVKYDFIPNKNKDVIPMWVADMDFKSPVVVEHALKKVASHNLRILIH